VPPNPTVETIPLDLLVAASRRPKYFAPMRFHEDGPSAGRLYDVLLPLTQAQREGITRLLGRAGQRMAASEFDGAWEDILACHRLARLVAGTPFAINYLVGLGHEGLVIDAAQSLLSNQDLSAEQARRCLNDLRALPSFASAGDKVDLAQRRILLDAVVSVARGQPLNPYDDKSKQITLALPGAIDWNMVLAEVNDYFDELVTAMHDSDPAARSARLQTLADRRAPLAENRMAFGLQAYFFGRPQASRDFAQLVITNFPEFFLRTIETRTNAAARMSAAQTGFALAVFQRERGAYPESLSALVPDLLPVAPIDPWSGAELIYRRTERGFVVYSVGPNQRDDGGGEAPFTGTDDEQMDDVIFRVEAE
jgi:hypothetical protein